MALDIYQPPVHTSTRPNCLFARVQRDLNSCILTGSEANSSSILVTLFNFVRQVASEVEASLTTRVTLSSEIPSQNQRVDYVLEVDGKPALIIEVKSPSAYRHHVPALATAAFAVGGHVFDNPHDVSGWQAIPVKVSDSSILHCHRSDTWFLALRCLHEVSRASQARPRLRRNRVDVLRAAVSNPTRGHRRAARTTSNSLSSNHQPQPFTGASHALLDAAASLCPDATLHPPHPFDAPCCQDKLRIDRANQVRRRRWGSREQFWGLEAPHWVAPGEPPCLLLSFRAALIRLGSQSGSVDVIFEVDSIRRHFTHHLAPTPPATPPTAPSSISSASSSPFSSYAPTKPGKTCSILVAEGAFVGTSSRVFLGRSDTNLRVAVKIVDVWDEENAERLRQEVFWSGALGGMQGLVACAGLFSNEKVVAGVFEWGGVSVKDFSTLDGMQKYVSLCYQEASH